MVPDNNSETTVEEGRSGGQQLVRQWRAQATPARAAVLLVHGIAEHCGRYDHVGQRLSEQGLHVRAFDLWGFGETTGARAFVRAWEDYLDQVEQQLQPLRREGRPVFVLGHSMGGLISLSYALSGRPQPAGFVLSAPALSADIPAWKKVMARLLSRVAPKFQIPNELDGAMLSKDPEVVRAYFGDPLVQQSTSARLGAEMLKSMERSRRGLHRLETPTFVIHGGADRLVPPAFSEPLKAVPCVQRRVFQDLRHEVLNEPEKGAVLDAIIGWIDDQLAQAQRAAG